MNHILVFHGTAGWAVAGLALLGAFSLLMLLERGLSQLAQRGGIHAGSFVRLGDGRYGDVISLTREPDAPVQMALVRPHGDDRREWLPADCLSIPVYEKAEL